MPVRVRCEVHLQGDQKSLFLDQNIAIIVDVFRVKGCQDLGRLSVVFDSHKAKIYDKIFH